MLRGEARASEPVSEVNVANDANDANEASETSKRERGNAIVPFTGGRAPVS